MVLAKNGTWINPCPQRIAPAIHELGVTGIGAQQKILKEHILMVSNTIMIAWMNPDGQSIPLCIIYNMGVEKEIRILEGEVCHIWPHLIAQGVYCEVYHIRPH